MQYGKIDGDVVFKEDIYNWLRWNCYNLGLVNGVDMELQEVALATNLKWNSIILVVVNAARIESKKVMKSAEQDGLHMVLVLARPW